YSIWHNLREVWTSSVKLPSWQPRKPPGHRPLSWPSTRESGLSTEKHMRITSVSGYESGRRRS
ncbi:hypothetical protein DNTS_030483, partial [Danionella cerebrum]